MSFASCKENKYGNTDIGGATLNGDSTNWRTSNSGNTNNSSNNNSTVTTNSTPSTTTIATSSTNANATSNTASANTTSSSTTPDVISYSSTEDLPPGTTFDMKQYWPKPAENKSFLKYYSRESGNNAILTQKHYKLEGNNYRLLDFYYNYPIVGASTLLSTWFYRIDPSRGVVEYKDEVLLRHGVGWADENSWHGITYNYGQELLHGNIVKLNDVITNTVAADGIHAGSYMWAKVFGTYKNFTLGSKTYNNVVAMTYNQVFCNNASCTEKFTDWSHFYLAPNVGIIKHVFYAADGTTYKGEANLYKSCTTGKESWTCPN